MSEQLVELTEVELNAVFAGRGNSQSTTITTVYQITLNLVLFSSNAISISFGSSAISLAGNTYQLGSNVARLLSHLG